MPRMYKSTGRFLRPDSKYNNMVLAKFINCLMESGKKTVAEQIVYDAFKILSQRVSDKDPLEVFETAMNNVKPILEVRSKRVGGQTYQVPVEVQPKRQQALATRWILQAARAKKGRPMSRRLADELLDAYNKQGAANTTRENVHRMAEANKAFAHFAW